MNNNKKLKSINLRTIIVPLIIITLVFFIVVNITINSIEKHFYNSMKVESLKYAKSYSHSLSKAAEAHEIVNDLLEEKVLVASRTTALYDGHHSNELLVELADILEVDEIDYYNHQGELIYSNMEELVGWAAYEGHPVHDFMISDNKSFVGDIRQDSVTGNYFKYGYFKASDGGYIQIGVMAEKILNFLGGFEIKKLINEMDEYVDVAHIYLLDNNFNLLGSTNNLPLGREFITQEVKAEILSNEEFGFINSIEGENIYDVFVPVYSNDSKIGTLVIGQSLKATETIVKQVTIIGAITLSIIFAALLYALISTYKKNKELITMAYYDSLTGLPNRESLKEFLKVEIKKSRSDKKAILLLKCSNFRNINLTYGFHYGDKILQELAGKMKELTNSHMMLFRFSTNRFCFYVDNYKETNDLITISNKLSEVFNSPFITEVATQYMSSQIGIVEIDNKYESIDSLFKDVSIAINQIKSNDSINYAFFNEEMERRIQREDMVERELRIALSDYNTEKLYLDYQPQVDLKTNRIIGFEALARMKTESLGSVSPIEFIDVAERKQLIVPLGKLILRRACEFIRTIIDEGYNDVKVGVNISGIQLLQDDFTYTVTKIIKETGINESRLELEITESILLDNYEIINDRLKTLRDQKIDIALDDFGTGYSSFSRLRELNIDSVKLDRYFINRINNINQDELITGDIISMAHKVGLAVVAEGVEIEEEKEYLIDNDCDIMQGYLFSRPLSRENALQILEDNYNEIV